MKTVCFVTVHWCQSWGPMVHGAPPTPSLGGVPMVVLSIAIVIVTSQASYQLTACTFRNSGTGCIHHSDSFNKACDTSLRFSGGTHFSFYVGRETAARIASLASGTEKSLLNILLKRVFRPHSKDDTSGTQYTRFLCEKNDSR